MDLGLRRNDAGGCEAIRSRKAEAGQWLAAHFRRLIPAPSTRCILPPSLHRKRGCKRAAGAARPGGAGVVPHQVRTPGSAEELPCFRPPVRRLASSGQAGPDPWEELPMGEGKGPACAGQVAPEMVFRAQNPRRVARLRPQHTRGPPAPRSEPRPPLHCGTDCPITPRQRTLSLARFVPQRHFAVLGIC